MLSPDPNWHPFLVHFTIALFVIAFVFMAAARVFAAGARSDELKTAGRWALWAAATITVLTIASGLYAYYTVAHDDPSHLAMTDHRNWALVTGALIIFLGAWSYLKSRRQVAQPGALLILMAVGVALLSVTGLKGAGLVYEYGLGVASLPKDEGPGHSHEAGEEHAEESPAMEAERPAAIPGSPEAAVDAFGDALAAKDEATVRALLAADVLIYESGGAERSLEEYAGHHMPADMAFVAAMERQLTDRKVFEAGDFAIVTSMGSTRGTFRERQIDLLGTETILLEKRDGNWVITHIHWSSRPAS
ncbi:MAG: DUF4440 domain-containing protein [Proteobacteria bacterium]|nr:DUF4440 domain-containing protein [Pseudomonadota bacterium]